VSVPGKQAGLYLAEVVVVGATNVMGVVLCIGVPAPGYPLFLVDPSLAMGGASIAAPMVTGCLDPANFQSPSAGKSATAVVTEGVPPVPSRLVDKIKKWEFVNMAGLLKDNNGKDPQFMVMNGQLVAVYRQSSSKTPLSILQWLKAFKIFMAILSYEDTTREEAARLAAHSYLILQLANDLPGSQWLQYDQRFVNGPLQKV